MRQPSLRRPWLQFQCHPGQQRPPHSGAQRVGSWPVQHDRPDLSTARPRAPRCLCRRLFAAGGTVRRTRRGQAYLPPCMRKSPNHQLPEVSCGGSISHPPPPSQCARIASYCTTASQFHGFFSYLRTEAKACSDSQQPPARATTHVDEAELSSRDGKRMIPPLGGSETLRASGFQPVRSSLRTQSQFPAYTEQMSADTTWSWRSGSWPELNLPW